MIELFHFNQLETLNPKAPVVSFFDSGIGGMALLEKILKTHPQLNFVYTADGALFPYGSQPLATIEKRFFDLSAQLNQQYQITSFVLACNTATCAINDSKDALGFKVINPIEEVTQVLKARFVASSKVKVLLIATPATVSSNLYPKMLGPQFELLQHPTVQLAQAAEEGWQPESLEMQAVLKPIEQAINDFAPQAIILGSTHYSWVAPLIQAFAPNNCVVLDTAACMAEKVLKQLSPKLLTGEVQHVLNTHPTPYFEQFALDKLSTNRLVMH